MDSYDIVVAGGGVIGCALARAFALASSSRILLLEKEARLAMHQSGRNSGVIHAGYNQKPGTQKARFVVEGNRRVRAFCRERNIPLHQGGILVVARDRSETEILRELERRGCSNGAQVKILDSAGLREREPRARGVAALWAPEGASFDSPGFVEALAAEARTRGVEIALGEAVCGLAEERRSVHIRTSRRDLSAKAFLNAAGLQADRLAHWMGVGRDYRVIPFRGEYHRLAPESAAWIRSHIYPTPHPRFPFLGVHLSRRTDGSVTAGPGAILSAGREAYTATLRHPRDLRETIFYPGLWRLFGSRDFQRLGLREWKKSFFRGAVAAEARRLVPELTTSDLDGKWSGIRAQLVTRRGVLVDDLVVEETRRSVHVLNAVSPALTCALPFADDLAARVLPKVRS